MSAPGGVRAIVYTSTMARSAERKAAVDSAQTPSAPKAPKMSTALAPTAAPEEMPRTNGSASALRTMACTATPTAAMPAPTTAASTERGNRSSQTMVYDETSSGAMTPPVSPAHRWCSTSPHEGPDAPIPAPQARDTGSATHRPVTRRGRGTRSGGIRSGGVATGGQLSPRAVPTSSKERLGTPGAVRSASRSPRRSTGASPPRVIGLTEPRAGFRLPLRVSAGFRPDFPHEASAA
ncbi:hypothetical protein EES40_35355 [Streptomyces sp. ADI93-02]|nr:hypothetical protein EES40_35355 [Streptomyces sp. ADI93-02]